MPTKTRKPHGQTRALKNFASKPAPDRLANARAQGQAQFDSIKTIVDALREAESLDSTRFQENLLDEARRAIEEDALSVQVRSGWHSPGAAPEDQVPVEYEILLCTGGPACRIIGELDDYNQPSTARLQVQDWFTPWTDMRPQVAPDDYNSEPTLLAYASVFYFGE